jgi:hypothetical protein
MFERIYASTWHHPVLFWAVGAPLLVYFLRKWSGQPGTPQWDFLRLFAVVFQIEILADAWLTSPWSLLPASSAVSVTFVILGDLRFFVLLERFSFPDRIHRWTASALVLSFIVPLASIPAQSFWSGRVLFLIYELAFLVLAAVIRFLVLPRRAIDSSIRSWLVRLTNFEMIQYATWAFADVIILLGADVGFLVRLIPNTMYYAAFVPFACFSAPEEIRS